MKHIWIRREYKQNERRVALAPADARSLIKHGINVTVEEYKDRIFSISEYKDAGCEIVPSDSWQSAPADAYILGLKELPNNPVSLSGKHIFFAHAFKEQPGSIQLLNRFQQGKGSLYDLEFLTDVNGKRVAAFGFYAGICAAAIGLEIWYKAINNASLSKLTRNYYNNYSALLEALEPFSKLKPNVLVIGASGRCGKGAISLLDKLHLEYTGLTKADTRNPALTQTCIEKTNIILNCIGGSQNGHEPIVTSKKLEDIHDNTTVVDLTCEPFSACNPISVYKKVTTFSEPVQTIKLNNKKLYVCAIDNIPTYLPKESSMYFSEKLLPLIIHGEKDVCWENAAHAFIKALKRIR